MLVTKQSIILHNIESTDIRVAICHLLAGLLNSPPISTIYVCVCVFVYVCFCVNVAYHRFGWSIMENHATKTEQ